MFITDMMCPVQCVVHNDCLGTGVYNTGTEVAHIHRRLQYAIISLISPFNFTHVTEHANICLMAPIQVSYLKHNIVW